ncbi:MAG TPA: LLM class flavin-dependent oxidoreductase, partial [Actinomycetota bacterium]|nr:LLM class flavin-dependent oxidoreductase [Actinomycetota bacterium]
MRIGIGLPNTIPETPGRLLVDWAARAEERGFSSLATIDRIAYPSYESLVTLAAAGAVTERIGLMTNILLSATRNPIILAKEAASVDQLSGGRLTLGLGVGGRRDDFVATERGFEDRGKRFEEDLELMQGAWRGELVGGCPKPPTPEPVRGNVPILIGGTADVVLDRVVRWGAGWTAGGSGPDQVGPFADRVRKAWADAGRDGSPRIVALSYFSLGDDAVESSRASLLDYYAFLGEWAEQIADGASRTIEDVRDTARRFEEAGVDELIFDPTVADLDQVDRLA